VPTGTLLVSPPTQTSKDVAGKISRGITHSAMPGVGKCATGMKEYKMTDYEIVCVQKKRRYIVAVGVDTTHETASKHWTVAQVRIALHKGDTFHTVDAVTGQKVYIEATDTIRTEEEDLNKDILDTLRPCEWTKS
jgi:hypothetical protein